MLVTSSGMHLRLLARLDSWCWTSCCALIGAARCCITAWMHAGGKALVAHVERRDTCTGPRTDVRTLWHPRRRLTMRDAYVGQHGHADAWPVLMAPCRWNAFLLLSAPF